MNEENKTVETNEEVEVKAETEAQETNAKEENRPDFDELLKTNKEYQSAFDKKVQKAIDTSRSKWEQEKKEEINEAKRLEKLTAEERAAEQLKIREEKLIKREHELNLKELKASAVIELGNRGLSAELANNLDFTNADTVKSGIEALEANISAEVERKVNERLRGKTPETGEHVTPNSFKSKYDEALKNNNTQEAIKNKIAAFDEGKGFN